MNKRQPESPAKSPKRRRHDTVAVNPPAPSLVDSIAEIEKLNAKFGNQPSNEQLPPEEPEPQRKEKPGKKAERYMYGNYDQYYGYRAPGVNARVCGWNFQSEN